MPYGHTHTHTHAMKSQDTAISKRANPAYIPNKYPHTKITKEKREIQQNTVHATDHRSYYSMTSFPLSVPRGFCLSTGRPERE